MKAKLSWVALWIALGGVAQAATPELVIYTYDSLVAKHGLGPEIFPIFEKKCGCKIKAVAAGDGGQLVSKLQLDAERGKRVAQIVLGLDEVTFERAKKWLEPIGKPHGWDRLKPEAAAVAEGFTPFDMGAQTFMLDRKRMSELKLKSPRSLADLLDPSLRRQIIFEDPRTSLPGLNFVLFTYEVYGKGFADFWRKLKPQWLTLAPGWDSAYGLFTRGEAPLVWSYATSQAYHETNGDVAGAGRRYEAIVLEEGQPLQIEGAALVKGAFADRASRDRAIAFVEFLISDEVQSRVSERNWMLPVVRGVRLSQAFENVPAPKRWVRLPSNPAKVTRAITEWEKVIAQKSGQ